MKLPRGLLALTAAVLIVPAGWTIARARLAAAPPAPGVQEKGGAKAAQPAGPAAEHPVASREEPARREDLRKIRAAYADLLKKERGFLRKLAEQAGSNDKATLALKQQYVMEQQQSLQSELQEIRSQKRKLEARLELARQGPATEPTAEPPPLSEEEVDRLVDGHPSVSGLVDELAERQQELDTAQTHAARVSRSPQAEPAVRSLRATVAELRRTLDRRREEVRPEVIRQAREGGVVAGESGQGEDTIRDLAMLSEVEAQLEMEIKSVRTVYQQIADNALNLRLLEGEIARLQAIVERIDKELAAPDAAPAALPRPRDGADGRRTDPARTPIRLVDIQGQPVAGAVASDFFFRDADHDPAFTPMDPKAAPRSDERGELAMTLEVPGHLDAAAVYAIRGDGPDSLVGVRRVTGREIRSGTPITVVMHPACRVRLRVECPGFRALAKSLQVALGDDGWWRAAYIWLGEDHRSPRPLFASSSRGELEFLLPPGRYMAWAYGTGTKHVDRAFEVQPGPRVLGLGVVGVPLDDDFARRLDTEKLAKALSPRLGVLLKGATEGARDVAYSPDGKRLASSHIHGADPHAVKLWDPVTGAELATLPDAGRGVSRLAFSPDGRTLAGLGWRGNSQGPREVVLWDVAARRELRTIGPGVGIDAMAFSPDGRTLATCGSGTVRFWDVASGRETRRIPEMWGGEALAFSPDGLTLAVNGPRGAFVLWDLARDRPAATLDPEGERFSLLSVAFSPDGRTLAAAGWVPGNGNGRLGRAWLYDLTQSPPARRAQLVPTRGGRQGQTTGWISAIALTPDGRRVVGAMCETIMIWDAATGAERDTLGHLPAGLNDRLAVAPDGRSLAVTQEVGRGIMLLDMRPKARAPFKVPNTNLERRGFTGN